MDTSRRKQLKDDYKAKLATGAVYALVCSGNGRRCVKSTVDLAGIRNRFRFAVSTGSCPDPTLRAEWMQYGAESFSLTVLEELNMKEGQTAREFADEVRQLCELWLEKPDEQQ